MWPVLTLQHLENIKRAALAQVAVPSQNMVFGVILAAHLSSVSELLQALEEFSAALVDLANTILRMSVKTRSTRSMRSIQRGQLLSP